MPNPLLTGKVDEGSELLWDAFAAGGNPLAPDAVVVSKTLVRLRGNEHGLMVQLAGTNGLGPKLVFSLEVSASDPEIAANFGTILGAGGPLATVTGTAPVFIPLPINTPAFLRVKMEGAPDNGSDTTATVRYCVTPPPR